MTGLTAVPSCGQCGSPMRQTYAYLTRENGCERVPAGLVCSNAECREQQHRQDRADQAAADEAALQRALASGLIVPDGTPEADRWIEEPAR